MDKVQKQLIDTYFRKRKIAMKDRVNGSDLKTYEHKYGVKNNIINIDNINDPVLRAEYMNNKYNTNLYKVFNFGSYGKDIALAVLQNNKIIFINREGNESIEGINPDNINSENIRAAYVNMKYNKNFSKIYDFGNFSDDIAFAYIIYNENKNKPVFINKKYEIDIGNIKLSDLNSKATNYSAAYFNSKYNTNYKYVYGFNSYVEGIGFAVVNNVNEDHIFINLEGKPDVGTLTPMFFKKYEKNPQEIYTLNITYNNTLKLLNNSN